MKELYKKLFEIQEEGLKFTKDAVNPFFKSKYLTLDNLLKQLEPVLNKHKLLIVHYIKYKEVVTEVVDVDGEASVTSAFPLQENLDPQKAGSTITYAKRYNLGQIFNIITDEDDDGNLTTKKGDKPSQPINNDLDL